MPARKLGRDNRRVVHTAAADINSPELVLVSPPDVAARARRLLPGPIRPFTPAEPAAVLSRKSFAAFYTVCIAGTLGPLLLAFIAGH
jgi:hypothetical protein